MEVQARDADDRCASRVDAFARTLADAVTITSPLAVDLVAHEGRPYRADAHLVEVRATDVSFDGGTVDEPTLHARLSDVSSQGRPVAVAIDATAPWAAIAPVVHALTDANVSTVDLVFQTAVEIGDSALATKLEGRAATEALRIVTEHFAAHFARCPPGLDAFGALADVGPNPIESLLDRLPAALRACDCKVDLDALAADLQTIMLPSTRRTRVELELAASADDGAAVSFDAQQTWSSIHTRLVTAAVAGPLHVELATGPDDEPEPVPEPVTASADR